VKDSIYDMREDVVDDIWRMTDEADYLKEEEWTDLVEKRMKQFELDLITSMK